MSKCIKVLCALLLGDGLGLCLTPTTQAAEDLAGALAESQFVGYGKMMYVVDDKKGGRPDQHTPGFGGRLGVETGSLHGLRLAAAWYSTQDLGLRRDNPRETDAYMFDIDKTPYSLWGEARLLVMLGRNRLAIGRQEIHSPLIDSYEYRIIPNLFEAVSLENRDLPDTTLTVAYVSRMSGLDGLTTFSRFRSMSEQAYTSLLVTPAGTADSVNGDTLVTSRVVGDRGVWLTGLVYGKRHQLQLWNAHGSDLLNTLYADGKFNWPLGPTLALTLSAQAYRVSAVGGFKDYLSDLGLNANYHLLGLKGTFAHAPSGLSIGMACNRFGGNKRTVTAFGNWGSYPEFVGMPYLYAEGDSVSAIARSRLINLTVALDLGKHGLPGQSLLFGHARIDLDEAILPDSDIVVNSLLYRGQLTKRLSARVAAESRTSDNARYDNDFVAMAMRYDF